MLVGLEVPKYLVLLILTVIPLSFKTFNQMFKICCRLVSLVENLDFTRLGFLYKCNLHLAP